MTSHHDLINADEARKFIELVHERAAAAVSHLRRPGVLHLCTMAPDAKRMATAAFAIGDIAGMFDAALIAARAGHNCFIETRTTRPGRPTERGKIEATIGVFALVVDRDSDRGRAGRGLNGGACIVETSPNNSHEWIFLRRALDPDDAKRIGGRTP
jgi:hypothetical protein